jgi:hypothetical protein
LSEKQNYSVEDHADQVNDLQSPAVRKQFVEPTVSAPVDVLEATTFFQAGTGGTNVDPGIV